MSPAAATSTMAEATIRPRNRALCTLLSSSVRTVNVPSMEAMMPQPASKIGKTAKSAWTAPNEALSTPHSVAAVPSVSAHANTMDAMMLPT